MSVLPATVGREDDRCRRSFLANVIAVPPEEDADGSGVAIFRNEVLDHVLCLYNQPGIVHRLEEQDVDNLALHVSVGHVTQGYRDRPLFHGLTTPILRVRVCESPLESVISSVTVYVPSPA